MAGPTASVLCPEKLTDARVVEVVERAFRTTPLPPEHSFVGKDGVVLHRSIEERPFIVTRGEEYPQSWQQVEESGFSQAVGWKIQDSIGIVAMCNDQVDHFLLGKLCALVAEAFGGIVDFGGAPHLNVITIDLPSLEADEIFAKTTATLPGQRHRLPFMSEGVRLKRDLFFCDAEFMKAWLAHKSFRMVK